MTENRMLVVDAELLRKIDENRGDMTRAEFINFIIDSQLGQDSPAPALQPYVTREEFQEFTAGIKELLRRFLDFFISYGMELGEQPKDHTFAELVEKLQALSASGGKPPKAK
jgi:hypothetical protein